MAQQFQTATTSYYLVSNSSLDHNLHNTFAWIIANSNQELWSSEGAVPGMTKDTHSGCSEGFGILAAIIFLDRYLRTTHQTCHVQHVVIHRFCDNLGLIQNVNCITNTIIPDPSLAISHDYDLHQEIASAIKTLPVQFIFQHIKGHQDKNDNDTPQSYKATLNIECDKWACEALAQLPTNNSPNMILPASTILQSCNQQDRKQGYKTYRANQYQHLCSTYQQNINHDPQQTTPLQATTIFKTTKINENDKNAF